MKKYLKFLVISLFLISGFVRPTYADITTGLVGWWKLDDGTGISASDFSGNGNTGTLVNGPAWTTGTLGQALDFDGVDDYVLVPHDASLNVSVGTFAAWIKTSKYGWNTVLHKQEYGTDGYWLGLSSSATFYFYMWSGETLRAYSTDDYLNDGSWHHIAVTYDGYMAVYYIDGSWVDTQDWGTYLPIGLSTAGFFLSDPSAYEPGVYGLQGALDDVRIYNRALSAQEINTLYNSSITTDIYVTATLDGQPWPSSGTNTIDYSLSGPSGNISNSVVPFTYTDVEADAIYNINYIGAGPAGATLDSITPISSQFLPDGASISFNFNFITAFCPLAAQPGRRIISFYLKEHVGSPDYAPYKTGPYAFNPPLPAGTYDVTLVASDGHTGQGGSGWQNQPDEIYYLKLLDQSGNLITSTNSTPDIPNDEDIVITLVNTNLQMASNLYSVEAWHGTYIDNSDYNSLVPVCAAFDEPFNYSLSNPGASNVTKTSGDAFAQNTITKTLTSGGTESVTLSVLGLPSGVSVDSISSQGCSPGCESTITFRVTPSAPVGTFPVTVTGSPLDKQTNFNLAISGDPLTASCSAHPTMALLGENVTLTADVSGGTPPYVYSWEGTEIPTNPSPNTNPFNISYNTVGQKNVSVTVTDSSSPPFQTTCPAITVRASIDPQYKEF